MPIDNEKLFEFKLLVKYHASDKWNQIARSICKVCDYDNTCRDYDKYIKRGEYFDSVVLINLLDSDGNFLMVVQ